MSTAAALSLLVAGAILIVALAADRPVRQSRRTAGSLGPQTMDADELTGAA